MKEDLERELANALSRREPPPWLESKIMAALERAPEPEPKPGFWERVRAGAKMRWVSAALAGSLVVTGVAWQLERAAQERAAQERLEGEAAKARLEQALQITSVKLRKIQQVVNAMQRGE